MKKYGLRIGNVGIEFISIEERNKALQDFTKGCDINISETGLRYGDGNGSFSVYDRDTKEILTNCCICKGVFGIDTCGEREYPHKYSYINEYNTTTDYICDACLAKKIKDKEIFDAKQLLNKEEK
jgi:hypothetical protein